MGTVGKIKFVVHQYIFGVYKISTRLEQSKTQMFRYNKQISDLKSL
ncbi:hypothetical protein VIBNIPon4_130097 [Vibrio nigripulchritudo POn4]|nr:hypothetical protein VIBNIAM115_1850005 [Vibrio nigripulchritudo AM115]CCN39401.1 hypothetical protein VIBNIFTn2_1040049 [Vibrio nigripulchritudo FTn2]CCN63502.1 hypothetical protein VIBNIPon4_130097 [Vibrio nigripulchritudo POn4]